MRLQVNRSGAWMNVATFPFHLTEQVKRATATIGDCSAAAGSLISFRIQDGQEFAVLTWSHGKGWTVPRWAEGYTWVP